MDKIKIHDKVSWEGMEGVVIEIRPPYKGTHEILFVVDDKAFYDIDIPQLAVVKFSERIYEVPTKELVKIKT